MNRDFKDWFTTYGDNEQYPFKVFPASRKELCEDAWKACKEEVLKILKKNSARMICGHGESDVFYLKNAKDEIEKL